jgi:hypothetical protein
MKEQTDGLILTHYVRMSGVRQSSSLITKAKTMNDYQHQNTSIHKIVCQRMPYKAVRYDIVIISLKQNKLSCLQ